MHTSPWSHPAWIAHRGCGSDSPENTLAALRDGYRLGYRGFEVDVTLTADRAAILMHDATLERTTSGQGAVQRSTWADISKLDAGGWHSPLYAGEPVPRLEQIARFCQGNRCWLNIEIKPATGLAYETGRLVSQLARDLWRSAEPAQWPLLTSFNTDALQAALETAPELPRGLLLDDLQSDWSHQLTALKCQVLVCKESLVTGTLLAEAQALGMHCLAYTVNDALRAHELVALGVDGMITDMSSWSAGPPKL